MLITRVMLIDIFQKLYLIKALIKKILIIFYDLHAYIHSCVEIMSLYCFTERSRSQILGHMIPTSYNSINDDREIFVFLKSSPAYKEITNIDVRETDDQRFFLVAISWEETYQSCGWIQLNRPNWTDKLCFGHIDCMYRTSGESKTYSSDAQSWDQKFQTHPLLLLSCGSAPVLLQLPHLQLLQPQPLWCVGLPPVDLLLLLPLLHHLLPHHHPNQSN